MSRRHAKKSNSVRIGIFEGKRGRYNQAILEVLWEQDRALTSWEIAKGMLDKLKPTSDREKAEYRIRNIYSVIQRKDGRLTELQRKNYITTENRKWRLNWWKGRIAVFIQNPSILEKLDMETYTQAFSLMRRNMKTPSDREIKLPFGMTLSVKGSEFRKSTEQFLTHLQSDPLLIRLVVDETKQLLKEGIDLDLITDENLVALLAGRKAIKKALKKYL